MTFLYKNNFDQLHKLYFIFQKFSSLNFFPYFSFFLFSFPSFSFLLSFLLPSSPSFFRHSSKPHTESTHGAASCSERPPPWRPSCSPPSPQATTSAVLPLPKSGHGRLPWRVSHKFIFLRGMTKMNAYDLPLAILTLNFIRNEL
jgi:hypothetical protein